MQAGDNCHVRVPEKPGERGHTCPCIWQAAVSNSDTLQVHPPGLYWAATKQAVQESRNVFLEPTWLPLALLLHCYPFLFLFSVIKSPWGCPHETLRFCIIFPFQRCAIKAFFYLLATLGFFLCELFSILSLLLGPECKPRLCKCSLTHSPSCKISLCAGPAGSQFTVSAALPHSYASLWVALVFTGVICLSEQVTHLIRTAIAISKA